MRPLNWKAVRVGRQRQIDNGVGNVPPSPVGQLGPFRDLVIEVVEVLAARLDPDLHASAEPPEARPSPSRAPP